MFHYTFINILFILLLYSLLSHFKEVNRIMQTSSIVIKILTFTELFAGEFQNSKEYLCLIVLPMSLRLKMYHFSCSVLNFLKMINTQLNLHMYMPRLFIFLINFWHNFWAQDFFVVHPVDFAKILKFLILKPSLHDFPSEKVIALHIWRPS